MNHNGLSWRPVRLSKQVHRLVLGSERLLFGSKPRKLNPSNETPDCHLEGPMDDKLLTSEECQLLMKELGEDSEVITVWKKLKSLCINAATRHLLSYPTPATASASTSTVPLVTEDDIGNEDEQEAKRRRVDEQQKASTATVVIVDGIFTHRLQLPTIKDARSFLSQCTSYTDGGVPFYCTMPPSFKRSTTMIAVAAIDCEMVGTIHGRDEVVRITLLDHKGRILVEEMVHPACGLEAVNDYRTAFTGLTQASFAELISSGKVVDLVQVQALMLASLSSESVVIGHSLDSDLRALRISHASCVDTAVLYPHPAGPLPMRQALRSLTLRYLGKTIQQQKKKKAAGHDSAEDAQAALELALLKTNDDGSDDGDGDDREYEDEEQEEGYGDQKGDGLLRTITNSKSTAPETLMLSISGVAASNEVITSNTTVPDWMPSRSLEEAMDKMNSFIYSDSNLRTRDRFRQEGMKLCVLQVEEGSDIDEEAVEQILSQRLSHTAEEAGVGRPAGLLLRLRQPSTIAVREMLARQRQARKASHDHAYHHSMAVGSSHHHRHHGHGQEVVWGGHDERRLREMLKLVHTAAVTLSVI